MRFVSGLVAVSAVLLAACGSSSETAGDQEDASTSSSAAVAAVDDVDEADATTATTQESGTQGSGAVDESTTPTTASTTTTTAAAPRVPTAVDLARTPVDLELIASVSSPVAVIAVPDSDDLWVAEQSGRVLRLPDGEGPAVADVGVDLRQTVSSASEQGLLGMALSPDGGRLFTHHTGLSGESRVLRWDVQAGSVNADSATEIITIEQPARNHNGGHLLFGPDGYLWVGLGDGGAAGDPWGNGQNSDTLLGAMLRLDVSGDGYEIPADNPFVDGGGAPEVAVWGVRNPWRFSFDSATADLWIADVGQDRFEEITVLRRGGEVLGANLGWNAREGDDAFRGGDEPAGHAAPFVDYGQTGGRCSVTGGEVYRGSGIPRLNGAYIFSDFCTGELLVVGTGADAEIHALDAPNVSQPTSFGVDANGELLVLSKTGGIFRFVPGE